MFQRQRPTPQSATTTQTITAAPAPASSPTRQPPAVLPGLYPKCGFCERKIAQILKRCSLCKNAMCELCWPRHACSQSGHFSADELEAFLKVGARVELCGYQDQANRWMNQRTGLMVQWPDVLDQHEGKAGARVIPRNFKVPVKVSGHAKALPTEVDVSQLRPYSNSSDP